MSGERRGSAALARTRARTENAAFAVLRAADPAVHDLPRERKAMVARAWGRLGREGVSASGFDLVRLEGDTDVEGWLAGIDADPTTVARAVLLEVKSTATYDREDFSRMFFSLTEAEVRNAEALGDRFSFAFVNTTSGRVMFASLGDIRARARSMHARWAVTLR